MGKLLRVLVVLLLLVSIGALVMAHILFSRRELLKGRILTLERNVISMSRSIESEPPEPPAVPPTYPEKDISPATAEAEPNPRRTDFWADYRPELEELDNPLMDLSERRRALMSYYRTDPVTGKVVLDPDTGAPIMDGPGTMRGVLGDLLDRASAQYNLLTASRQQMRELREELVTTIEEHNALKDELRQDRATIARLEAEKAELERQLESTRRDLAFANERIEGLEQRIGDLEQEQLVLIEEKDTLEIRNQELVDTVADLRAQVKDLRRLDGGRGETVVTGEDGVATGMARVDLDPGAKGSVVSVDQTHLFLVMELDETFVEALLAIAAENDNRLPMLEMMVMRPEGDELTFVTKIRMTQLKKDQNLAIGDILSDWQQGEIRVGDVVYYQ